MFILAKKLGSTIGLKSFWCLSDIIPKCARFCSSDSTYYKHRYSPDLEMAINKQIQAEQQAAQDYLNLSVALLHPSVCRLGAGGFFMRLYHEELEHMEKLIQYQLLRGATPCIQGLSAPAPKCQITLIDAFRQALELEHGVTKLIGKLTSIAESDKDYHCANFLTTVFLEEQMNSINMLSQHVTKIASICNDPDALLQYDLLLLKTYPYTCTYKSPMK